MGNLLGAPVTEKDTFRGETESHGAVRFAVSSMQGWRVHMEDAHIAEAQMYAKDTASNNKKIDLPGHALFAVFDGHGGSYSALYAGRNLCRVLSRQAKFVQYAELYTAKGAATDEMSKLLEGALTDAFVDLDKEIACALKGQKVADADEPYHEGQPATAHGAAATTTSTEDNDAMTGVETSATESGSETNAMQLLDDEGDSGTTACVILLSPDFVVCANAGDSRACLRQLNGRTVPLSYDHKPDDEGEERRIRAAGGYVAGGRVEGDLAVSRGLGDFRFKQLDVVMKGVAGGAGASANNPNGGAEENNQASGSVVTHPKDQKVSPIPDIMVHPRDTSQDAFCIIACDGIWDVQTNEHATKLVADLFVEGESEMGLMCEEVCDICLRLGSKDNMTVLLMQFAAQKVNAEGSGGVLVRRKAREAENSATQSTGTNLST